MHEKTDIKTMLRGWMEAFTMRSMRSMAQYVKEKGLSMPQFSIMMRLYYQGGCEVHDIGTALDISAAGASQLVDRLVQGGLLVRAENPDDRRVRQIELSAKGRALIDQGVDERYRWLDDLLAAMRPSDHVGILRSLSVLVEAEQKLPDGGALVGSLRDAIREPRIRP
jgi:DNA-binding MarR family transcriptional regulator